MPFSNNGFAFKMFFPRANALRLKEVAGFIRIMQSAFGFRDWQNAPELANGIAPEAVESYLRKESKAAKRKPKFGLASVIMIPDVRVMLDIQVGVAPDTTVATDWMSIDFSDTSIRPELNYFREAIRATRPYHAYIFQYQNTLDLHHHDRLNKYGWTRPTILNWWHYLDERFAESVGGVARCLTAPVYSAEQFCDGVLIQLTKDWFDPSNADHIAIQRAAMEHLGLEP